MIPTGRNAEEDLFAELGLLNSGSAFLKHLRAGKIKVVRGMRTCIDSMRSACSDTPIAHTISDCVKPT